MSHFKMPRDFYIPKGAAKVEDKQSDAVAYLYALNGRPCAMMFWGKSAKPVAHNRFLDDYRRAAAVENSFVLRREAIGRKKTFEAERRKPHAIEVGQIFRASWGYDQTNVNFYEATRVISDRMIEVREIKQKSVDCEKNIEHVVPLKGEYCGPPLRRFPSFNCVRIDDVITAHIWEGNPAYRTAAGWGH